MEKVKVVKEIPGMLNVGDILVSPEGGCDFCLEEVNVSKRGSEERFVSLDYITVCENIPQFFMLESVEDENDEAEFEEYKEAFETTDAEEKATVRRTDEEIAQRYEFFNEQFEAAAPASEAQVVYKNLMWFIEWLNGDAELV